MPIKNLYTANKVANGDIFVVTVKVMVMHDGTYRLYRCPWPATRIDESGAPDGDRMYPSERYLSEDEWFSNLQIIAESLIPLLRSAGLVPDI